MLRTNVVLTLLVIFSFSVSAQNRTYNIYIDKDNKTTTGCSVVQPDFATQFDGIDGYISVTTSASPVVISSSLYHECVGGSFDGGSAVVTSALGFNTAANGDDVFEFQIGTSDLGIRSSSTAKLYFSVESDISSDIVTVNNSGNGIFVNVAFPIPTLSTISLLFLCLIVFIVAKKAYKNKALILASVMLFSTMVWGMFLFVIDGEANDWSSFNPINDPVGDNSAPANFSDITKVFAILEQDYFTARMDVVDVENQAPTIISANSASVMENQTSAIDVESTDVNGDIEGAGLTYALTGAIDDSLFSIDVNFGVVTFLVAPDFEAPSDSGADNNYDIQVTVTDSGGLTDVQDIVVTVTNDINDDASVEFQSVSSSSTDEATVLNIVVELTALAPLTAPLSVDVVDAGGGSALSGTDYTAIGTQTITFPIGATGGAVLNATLTPNNDTNVEGDETVNLLMQNVSGPGTLGVQTNHTATITDDDFAEVSFQLASSATVNEATPLDIDVVINIPGGGQLDTAVTVDVVDAGGGSATSGVDYNVFGVQALTFPIGTTNGTVQTATLTPLDDASNEGNETVNLALQNLVANSSVSLGLQTTHTATITDDEATVEFSLASSATVNEAVALDVGVVLTTPIPLTAPLSVDVVDAGTGSATSVVDYISFGTQTLTFPIGSTNGTTLNASLVPINDNNVENNESVNLQLQNLVGTGSIGTQSTHTATITEDDAASVSFFAATSATVDESTPLNIGVQLTIPVGGQLEIPLSIDVVDAGGGSATSTTDYSAIGTQTFTFSFGAVNGNTLNAVLIPIDDPDTEGDETVNLLLQNLNGPVLSSIGVQSTHTATITDDDNQPPVAVNDAYDSIGNVGITVPAVSGVIANDTDPNMDVLTVTAYDATSVQGGVVVVNGDGSFIYSPPTGYTGADSFTYTISDGTVTDSAVVTLTVANKIWFIDGTAAAGGDGSLAAPFVNTSDFMSTAADGNGDCIYVARAGGFNYSSVITLLDNQKLIGEGSVTGLAAECGIIVPPFSNTLPATGGLKPVLIGATGVNVASGNTIRGFEIVNAHQKIVGSNFGTLKVRDVDLILNGEAINLQNGTADIILDSVAANGSSGYGIRLSGVSGVFTVTGSTFINSVVEEGILIENSNLVYTFGNIQITGRQKAGIVINAFTGGVQTGVFGDVTIINSGAANNTTGFAIDNIVTAGSAITIANVSIDNQLSNSAGMALSNNDGATINVNGGSVSNSSGPNVSISSGSGTVNFAASIVSLSGRSLQVLNNDGGTINLTGPILGTSGSSTGVYINNNTGATINISGQLTLSTATNDAFTATGGGTLNVTEK
ncbi:MAG: Ig-like domain-containing protein [Gammaproteobacteria bacterium]